MSSPADSHVASLFSPGKTTVIANYPPLDFARAAAPAPRKPNSPFRVVYVGGVSRPRGIARVLQALDLIGGGPVEFLLAGNVNDKELLDRIKSDPRVVYHGVLPWEKVSHLLAQADAGLALFQPVPAFEYYPGENIIKLWEYLAVGLPVIISNFPRLKLLIEQIQAGIAVDAANPAAIAGAIRRLRDTPGLCRRLGDNGRAAVLRERHWEMEARKLAGVYQRVMGLPL